MSAHVRACWPDMRVTAARGIRTVRAGAPELGRQWRDSIGGTGGRCQLELSRAISRKVRGTCTRRHAPALCWPDGDPTRALAWTTQPLHASSSRFRYQSASVRHRLGLSLVHGIVSKAGGSRASQARSSAGAPSRCAAARSAEQARTTAHEDVATRRRRNRVLLVERRSVGVLRFTASLLQRLAMRSSRQAAVTRRSNLVRAGRRSIATDDVLLTRLGRTRAVSLRRSPARRTARRLHVAEHGHVLADKGLEQHALHSAKPLHARRAGAQLPRTLARMHQGRRETLPRRVQAVSGSGQLAGSLLGGSKAELSSCRECAAVWEPYFTNR
jgi:hypothetical protein